MKLAMLRHLALVTAPLLGVVLPLGVACDPPRDPHLNATSPPASAAGTEVGRQATPPGTRPTIANTEPPRMPTPMPLSITQAEVRQRGDAFEIEVTLDRRLPTTNSSRPSLRVGDEVVRRSLHPQGELDRLLFLVTREQFERMPDGATLEVHAPGFLSANVTTSPRLDKTKVVTP